MGTVISFLKTRQAAIVVLIFLGIRLFSVTHLPIFNDESIYLHWGRIVRFHPDKWFLVTALDGKPPGTAIIMALLSYIPGDPLIVARLFSILCSLGTFVLMAAIARRLFARQGVLAFLILLAISPYLLFFDTLALQEPIMTLITTLILYLVLSLENRPAVWKGILIGFCIGAGAWIKSTIFLLIPPLFFSFLWLFWQQKNKRLLLVPIISSVITASLCLLPLMTNPLYPMIPKKEHVWVMSLSELFSFPYTLWADNAWSLCQWYVGFATPIVTLFGFLGMTTLWKNKQLIIPFLFWILPITIELFVAKLFTARYIIFVVPVFMIFVFAGINILRKYRRIAIYSVIGTTFVFTMVLVKSPLLFSQILKFVPKTQSDFSQYVTGWPSGYGIPQAISYVTAKADQSPILVFVRPDSGNPEDAMYLYLERSGKPIIVVSTNELASILSQMQKNPKLVLPIYFISRGPQYQGLEQCLIQKEKYDKPTGSEFIGIFEIRALECHMVSSQTLSR